MAYTKPQVVIDLAEYNELLAVLQASKVDAKEWETIAKKIVLALVEATGTNRLKSLSPVFDRFGLKVVALDPSRSGLMRNLEIGDIHISHLNKPA